jgi:predicted porin
MKQAIVAAVVALATMGSVSAQSAVEVYGKMRVYMESDEVGTASAVTKQSNDTSRLGFRGTEDLGNGAKAFFTLETGVGADSPAASTLGDRTSIVGLSTSVGRIGLGRDKHQVTRVLDAFDPIENAFGTTVGTIHQAHGSRTSNTAFLTVTPAKGFNLHYQNSASETTGTKNVQVGGVDGTMGPISLAIAHYTNSDTGAARDESTIYGGKLTIGATKTTLFGIYSDDTVDGAETTGKTFGVQQKISAPVTLMASYGEKSDIKAYAVGASYAMSKRTSLHARYRNENADAAASDRTQYGVGIEHNF